MQRLGNTNSDCHSDDQGFATLTVVVFPPAEMMQGWCSLLTQSISTLRRDLASRDDFFHYSYSTLWLDFFQQLIVIPNLKIIKSFRKCLKTEMAIIGKPHICRGINIYWYENKKCVSLLFDISFFLDMVFYSFHCASFTFYFLLWDYYATRGKLSFICILKINRFSKKV